MTNNPDNDAGKAHFKARRFAEAIECFTRAHASLPNDALVLGNRSAAYSSLGQHSKALADAQAAVALDYAYVKGYYRQATALLALDRAAEAAQAASAGLNLEPRNGQMAALKDQAMARLAAQRAEESEGSGEGSDDDDDEAEEAEQQQQDVRMSAEEEAEQRKARAEARKAAGNGHFKEKRYREAASEYSRAMEIDPANATYPLNRSAALLQLNDGKQALADAQAALELSPGLVKAHVRASKALCLLGRFSDARRQLETAAGVEGASATLAPEFVELERLESLLRNGRAALERTDAQAAREAAMTLSTLADKCPCAVGVACLQMEAVLKSRPQQGSAQVLSESSRWLRSHSEEPDLLTVRGKALYASGQLEQALKHCAEALRLDPDHSSARKMRLQIKELEALKAGGNGAFSAGRYDEAIGLYSQAIEFDPNLLDLHLTLYTNRATAKFKKGDYAGAIADCDAALGINGRHLKAVLRRAACRLELEQYNEAIADYEEAQQLEPNDRGIAQSLRQAKLELKKSLRKDLYKVIGVGKHATESEIKKGYRKSAMQWHPDRHSAGTDEEREEAEKRFKEVGQAFDILSDPQKKQKYDAGMDVEEINGGGGGGGGGHQHVDPMDIFAQMGGFPGGGGGFGGGGMGGMPGGFNFRHGY